MSLPYGELAKKTLGSCEGRNRVLCELWISCVEFPKNLLKIFKLLTTKL